MSWNEHECETGPSEYDAAVEGFKELLRKEVSEETESRLKQLEASNQVLRAKVANLSQLEREAEGKIRDAQLAKDQAERTAKQEAVQLRANELLAILAEPKFKVRRTNVTGPKCDRCDEHRYIIYTTPLGKEGKEYCDCNKTTVRYVVSEQRAYSVGTNERNTGIRVWYSTSERFEKEKDYDDHFDAEMLRVPTTIEGMLADYNHYGFDNREAAQALADAKNVAVTS